MTDTTLGQMLTTARHAADRTLRGVATEVGMAASYLQGMEHDKVRTPSPRHLKGLADALGLDYVDLMRAAGYHMPVDGERPLVPSGLAQDLRDATVALVRVSDRLQALRP